MADYDVVVLGSGLAGGCAALEAAAGARGLIAEALFLHYMTLNQWKVDASIVRRLSARASTGTAAS